MRIIRIEYAAYCMPCRLQVVVLLGLFQADFEILQVNNSRFLKNFQASNSKISKKREWVKIQAN